MSTFEIAESRLEWEVETFWRELCPALRIGDLDFLSSLDQVGGEAGDIERLRDLIRTEGYFQLPPPVWELPITEMSALIARLAEQNIPTVFAFVYDEFWALSMKLTRMLEGLLGPGFLRLPDFWAWHVDPAKGESGWRPHRDKDYNALRPDRSAKALTVWVPLSESTPLNGCIYILPADRDPVYGTVNDKQIKVDLPDIRALPAQPGSIFVWTQALLHWGSHACPREKQPRISVAIEFQAGDVPPYNEPLMQPLGIPAFNVRVRLAAKLILQYQHKHGLPDEAKAIAEAILR
jgi:hypothetical protein